MPTVNITDLENVLVLVIRAAQNSPSKAATQRYTTTAVPPRVLKVTARRDVEDRAWILRVVEKF